jgi:hypothetical protein
MKNKQGQINIGWMVVVGVSILIGLAFLQIIAQNVYSSTNLKSVVNQSVTLSTATTSNFTDITGWQSTSGTYVITNGTDNIGATNLTVVERIGTDGLKSVSIQDVSVGARWSGKVVNITGSYGPDGYIDSSGGRSITALIVLMTALVILVIAIPNLREYFDI